jgi:fatty-acyl-CoA synthase
MTKQIQNPSVLSASHMYNKGLEANAANHVAMSPISFLERAAMVYPNKPAVVHGSLARNWKEVFERSKSLASALQKMGVGLGDTVAVMLPNHGRSNSE